MNIRKISLNLVLLLIGSVAAGAVLLYIVFLLPSDHIFQNVQSAGEVFSIEGIYPVVDGSDATIIDNWTDSLMLENAFFEKEGASTLEKAMAVYRPEFQEGVPTRSLLHYLSGKQDYDITSYTRYWHGYLVVLKPLLMVTDYLGIRGLNRIVQAILVLVTAIVIWRKVSVRYVVPWIAAFVFLRPNALVFSMQFSTIFYISTGSILIMALCYHKLAVKNGLLYFFLLVGIITNYIDFLTYPIATLGIPLTLLLCIEKKRNYLDKIKGIVLYSFCWGIGYFGMWIGKWAIASVFLKYNVFTDAFSQARSRISVEMGEETVSRGTVILKNLTTGFENHGWLAVLIIAVVLMVGLLKIKRNWKELLLQFAPFLIVSIMPIIWYGVLSNHSHYHHWFTYRALSVSVFALLCMGMSYYTPKKRR